MKVKIQICNVYISNINNIGPCACVCVCKPHLTQHRQNESDLLFYGKYVWRNR